jgi:Periplasmic binding protein
MTPQQWRITAVVVAALAIVIGTVVALVSSGGDDDSIETSKTTTSSSSTSTLPTTSSTVPQTQPVTVVPPTIVPGSTVIVPGSTTTPTTQAPTTAPTTQPPSTTSTTQANGSPDVGISPTEIQLAVIADDPSTFEGMQAWQSVVNRSGGMADRKVRLDLLTTDGTAEGYAAAVQTACDQDFAIVGSFSLFDAASGDVGCGAIPDLPVEPVTPAHAVAENAFAVFPREPATEAVGPYKWLLGNVEECCSQFWVVPDLEPDRARTLATIDAAAAVGFETAGTVDLGDNDPPEPTYDEIVEQIVDTGATFAASGLDLGSTQQLRQAGATATGVHAWFCGSQCYDQAFLDNDAVESQYVAIETAPLSDRVEVAGVRSYVRAAHRADQDPTYEGLRAFAAGLLFQDAAEQVVDADGDDGLTRARLLEALGGVTSFTADGIIGSTDVAAGAPSGCFVLLQVRDGKFARVNPTAVGSLDCGPQNLQAVGD